jgi:hypothetical protein
MVFIDITYLSVYETKLSGIGLDQKPYVILKTDAQVINKNELNRKHQQGITRESVL